MSDERREVNDDDTFVDEPKPVLLPAIDELPKSGEWADEHPEATDEEIEWGNRLGEWIDPDDDDDAGQL